jgi:hypothetical protein
MHAKVYPGKALLREMLWAEVAGEHNEKKLVDNIDWDTKTLVEGKLGSRGRTGRDGQLLVTGELPSLLFWHGVLRNRSLWYRRYPR